MKIESIGMKWCFCPLQLVILVVLLSIIQISSTSSDESHNVTSQPAEVTPATTTTTATPHTMTTKEQAPKASQQNTTNNQDRNEAIKTIREHMTSIVDNRFAMNKPTLAPQTKDFAPESIEARVADSTTQFGLNFIKNLELNPGENVLISPISLQNLLNMILLGSDDNSKTQQELAKVLGYEGTDLFSTKDPSSSHLKPHEAMRNVLESIMKATHLSVSSTTTEQLFNANSFSLANNATDHQKQQPPGKLTAHLQTIRENELPLSAQVNFTLANLILTDESIKLRKDYERDLKTYYNVNVEQFSRQQTQATSNNDTGGSTPLHERVNNWVKNMTQNQIEKLAEEADLSGDDLMMILLNAAHFKGRWLYTFNPKATYERVFYNDGLEKGAPEVKFMRQKGTFGYADFGQSAIQAELNSQETFSKISPSEDAETLLTEDAASSRTQAGGNSSMPTKGPQEQPPIIELSKEEARRLELTSKLNCSVLMLPFSLNDGQELSMVILLPTKRDGLGHLQAALTWPALNEIYRSLSEQQVQVEIPKFSFEASHDAKKTLKQLGLNQIFNEAHFDRMFEPNTTKEPEKVGKVIHKAKISVDEEGAEAAAASMASIVLRNFIRPPTPVFVADHPFLFVIRHNRSNMPLFMGRVSHL